MNNGAEQIDAGEINRHGGILRGGEGGGGRSGSMLALGVRTRYVGNPFGYVRDGVDGDGRREINVEEEGGYRGGEWKWG